MIDYEVLLKKYIDHVAAFEGATFLDRVNEPNCNGKGGDFFTAEEVAILKEIEAGYE
jgi:hypothetical protein